jgi:type II secretory pathway pseudopilin PulG
MPKYNQGLSAIEFFVVVIIIGLLTGCIMIFMMSTIQEANDAERRSDIAQLMRILVIAKINDGLFPFESAECEIGNTCSVFDKMLEDQMIDPPKDPRGGENYYRYWSDGFTFILKATMSDDSEYVYDSN